MINYSCFVIDWPMEILKEYNSNTKFKFSKTFISQWQEIKLLIKISRRKENISFNTSIKSQTSKVNEHNKKIYKIKSHGWKEKKKDLPKTETVWN